MIGDAISSRQRLSRLSPDRWQGRLALLFFAVAIILALMCENVNAAPQMQMAGAADNSVRAPISVGAAPFIIGHPMCQTGFTIAQRFDERNSSGAIIKSVWVRKCVRVPKIIYGGKV